MKIIHNMSEIHTCRVCNGKGRLIVKRKGFIRRYIMKCHDCKAATIEAYTPEKAIHEWNTGWVFGGTHIAL